MALDLESLINAVQSLNDITELTTNVEKMNNFDDITRIGLQAGVIQNFEFTYELCWKFIKRWIRENRTPEDADNPRTRKDLFRLAAQYELIEDPIPWFSYGEARNISAHTYNKDKAEEVYNIAVKFVNDARYLLDQLTLMND